MKFIFLLSLLSFLFSCASNVVTPEVNQPEIISTETTTRQQPDNITELKLFTARDQDLKNYSWLKPSIDCAHKVINSSLFTDKIKEIKQFDYAPVGLQGLDVLNQLQTAKTVSVRMYYKRFTSAIAYTYVDAKEIYLNTKWVRPVSEIVNTLVHEATHTIGFHHGDNYAAGKEKSVPYFVGDLAEQTAKELCK